VRAHHHTSPTSAALVASPQMSGFQDIHPHLSFVGWHRSDLCTELTNVRWLPLLAAVVCSLLTVEHAWSRDHATSSVTAVFATAGPTLWNSLPEQLSQPDITFGQFKRSLKTFVFG